MKIEEIRIPAPWGHIAAKTWGEKISEAVIVTHGFQDNAGSFDRLIPLLPRHFYYICVDLPGHGLSSPFHHMPMPIHYVNFLLAYKMVADYFRKSNYALMGHSFGGELSVIFAQMYPHLVSKLIVLDAVYPFPMEPDMFAPMLKNAYNHYFERIKENSGDRPTYNYSEIVEKIQTSRYNGELTFETAEDLAKRMIECVGGGKYVITTDRNLKGIIYPGADMNYNLNFFERYPVECPVLMLLVPGNEYTSRSKRLVEHFEKSGFHVKTIEGHHHVHHTNPEVVAGDVTAFLNVGCSKL